MCGHPASLLSAMPSPDFICRGVDCVLCRWQLFRLVPCAGSFLKIGIVWGMGPHCRLSLAHIPAGSGHDNWRLCNHFFADQKRVSGRDQKQYVMTARAKGLSEARVLYGHVFRNAMLIVMPDFPAHLSALFLPAHCLLKRFSRSTGWVCFPMKASSIAIIRWYLPRFIFSGWWGWWLRSSPT